MSGKLFVGNLGYGVTEDQLRELFGQFGEVHSVAIITDRDTGRPRGFGFVELENPDQAIEALHGQEFEGRPLTVNEARERSSGGGGGFRRDGGGGRGGRPSGGRRPPRW